MVELTARRQSHGNRCGNVRVGMRFPDEWFRLVGGNVEEQAAVFLPWTRAEIRVMVTAVDYLTEDGNGTD